MTRAAEINADAWSRRRLLTVLVSGIAAALALMLGLELALYYAVQPGVSDGLCRGSVLRKDHDDRHDVRCDGRNHWDRCERGFGSEAA
ncbi:hypothetical protein M3697_12530, partial [Janibacter melonis]|uniref:hypothetical protein n=1 Tax=Janibacter melonis TaxID=262209 RepID=UPI002042D918